MYKCLHRQVFADSEGYRLIPVRQEDIESIRQWRNAQMEVLRQSAPISREEQEKYYKQQVWPLFSQERPRQILFSFLLHEQCIGYGGLTNLDWASKRAELSFLIDPRRAEEAKLYAQDLRHFLGLLTRILFKELKFHRLFAETFAFRRKTIALLEQFGFKQEGILKDHVFKRDQWVDSVILGLLDSQETQGVLITSLSKKLPLIQAVRRAFQRIHGADSSSSCIGQYGVDHFWHCPLLRDLSPEDMIAYCQEHAIAAIIPTRNDDVAFFAAHLRKFLEKGIHPLVSPAKTVETCLDKKRFADEMGAAGFPVIPTYLSMNEFEATSYVVKERRGAGAHNIALRLDRKSAQEYSENLEDPLFQPFIEGKEWSVDLYRSFSGQVMGCVARMRDLVVNGESQITTTARYPELEILCANMAAHLNIYGPAVFQVIEEKPGIFSVIECNPRFGGASTASVAAGLHIFHWFFAECQGQPLDPFIRIPGEIRQIRFPQDRVFFV